MSAAEASPLPTLASSNVITPDNHGAYVTITASLMLVSMVLLTGLRLSIRYPFTQLFGLDDAAIVISAICAIAQTVAILEAVKAGLGRHVLSLSDDMRETAQKLVYASNVLFVVSLSLSKTATSLLMSRLTRARNQVVAAYVTSAIIMMWGFAFLLGVSINCNAARPWDMRIDRCSNWQEIWTSFGVIGVMIELVLAVLPAYLLWGLQMSLGCKATVAFGFCFRLAMVPIEAFRLYYLSRTLSSADPTFDIIPFILLTQVEQHYSLIAATIPCLRPFLKAANTGLLDVNPTQVENCGSYLNSGGSASHTSYAMRSIDRASRAPSSRTNHHRPSKILTTATTITIPEPVSPGTREAINIATGFKAFDAHHAGIELPSPQTTTTTATTPSSPPHTLDAIAIAPMSASPTVAKHMLAAAAAPSTTQPSVTARAAPASPPLPDDSSFTSDGSEKMIIRKETALHVRYSPIVGAERRWRGDAELAGVPMGLDLERVDTAGSIPIGVAADAPPWRRGEREDCRAGAWLEEATPPREEGRGTEKGWDRRRR